MALTTAQRQIALQAIMGSTDVTSASPIPAGIPLATILPATTAAQVWAALVAAIGTTFDTQLTQVLAALGTLYGAQLTAAQAQVATLQAQIAAL